MSWSDSTGDNRMTVTNDEAKRIVTSVMPRYNGTLTQEQVAEGVRLSQDNAVRLLNSARLLLHDGDAPTAMSLAILALEENGKVEILHKIGSASNSEDIKKYWREYRDHKSKTSAFLKDYAAQKGIVGCQEVTEFCEHNSDMLPLVDLMKQLGFYTDCSGNCHWHDPKKISDIIAVTIFSAAEKAILGNISTDAILLTKAIWRARNEQ